MEQGSFDLGSVLSQLTQSIVGSKQDTQTARTALDENSALRQKSIEALQESKRLESELLMTDMNQALELQTRKQAIARTFGTDILDVDNRISYLAREQAAAVDEAISQSKRASELNQMNIFDDPLSYMVERPFAFRHSAASAESVNRAKITETAINNLNKQTQDTVETQKAINTEVTAEEIAKKAQLVKLQAEDAIRMAKANSNDKLVNDIKTLRQIDGQTAQLMMEGYKAKRHEQEFNMRMEEMQANRDARAKQKKTEQEELAYLMMRYNLGAEMMQRAKVQSVGELQAMLKYNKKDAMNLAEMGERVWVDPNPQTGTLEVKHMQIAATPGESAMALKVMGGQLPQTAERTKTLFSSVTDQVISSNRTGKVTPDQLAADFNKIVLGVTETDGKGKSKQVGGIVTRMRSDMETKVGQMENIYRAPSVDTIASLSPDLVANPMWKQIVEPAVLAEGKIPTVNEFVKQGRLAIAEKKATPEQVAQFVSSYYAKAALVNNSTENYRLVGLKPQDGYVAHVKSAGVAAFGGVVSKPVDATNYNQVLHSIMYRPIAGIGQAIGAAGENAYKEFTK